MCVLTRALSVGCLVQNALKAWKFSSLNNKNNKNITTPSLSATTPTVHCRADLVRLGHHAIHTATQPYAQPQCPYPTTPPPFPPLQATRARTHIYIPHTTHTHARTHAHRHTHNTSSRFLLFFPLIRLPIFGMQKLLKFGSVSNFVGYDALNDFFPVSLQNSSWGRKEKTDVFNR